MSNPVLELYKQHIGQYITTAPSPFSNWLRGKLLEVSEESISVEFIVRKEMCNPMNLLHGGMMAAIMDDLIGMTIFANGYKQFYFSLNLDVVYYAVAKEGSSVIARTKLVKKNQRLVQAECYLYGNEELLLAKGSANLISTEGVSHS